MQYNNYNIQITAYGCIIRDSSGKFIIETSTEQEAMEYIDEELQQHNITSPVDNYKRFCNYCKNMNGKMWIDDKLCCCFKNVFLNFVKSFEKLTDKRVIYHVDNKGGEVIYVVDEII